MVQHISFKYRAFLSYAHADLKYGSKLHRQLERYAIGRDLVGRETARGAVPKTLRPIFRDRDDFAGGHTLSEATIAALDQSATLIVLCSRKSAARPAVIEEVRLFRWRHPDRPIIPVIIDGGHPESFPSSLLHEINSDGSISDRPITILGPDLRDSGDGALLGLAKIVAGLTGLSTDEIFRRAERDRRRRLTAWVAGLATILMAVSGLALWAEINRQDAVAQRGVANEQRQAAVTQQRVAETERDQALVTQSRFLADVANRMTANGDPVSAALVAFEGLPDKARGRERPYVSQAELALYRAFVASREVLVFGGHSGAVYHAALSPDGTKIATASKDATARVFEVASGKTIAVLKGHRHRVIDVVFTPDSSKIVTASLDATAKLWDATTGAELKSFDGHDQLVKRVKVNSVGTRIVTASLDDTARIWDIATGAIEQTLNGHLAGVFEAEFSPNGKLVATSSADQTSALWDVETGMMVRRIGGHRFPVDGVHFSPDGRRLLTRSRDKTARVVDVTSGDLVADLIGHGAFVQVARFSPDGKTIVTADDDGEARLWAAVGGRLLFRLTGHKRRIHDAQFSPSGALLATSGEDGTIRVWDVATGALRETIGGHSGDVLSVMFVGEDRLVSTGKDQSARLWSLKLLNIVELRGHTDRVYSAEYSRDGKLVLTGSADKTARVWEAETGRHHVTLGPHRNRVKAAVFSADATRAYTGDANLVRVWDVSTGAQVDEWEAFPIEAGSTPQISRMALHPDGKKLAVAGNLTVRIFDIDSKRQFVSLRTKEYLIQDVSFSRNGDQVVTSGFGPIIRDDGSVEGAIVHTSRVWNTSTGEEVAVLDRQPDAGSAAFSRTDDNVLTLSANRRVQRKSPDGIVVHDSAFVAAAQTATEAPGTQLIAISRFQGETSLRRQLAGGDIASTSAVNTDIWWRPAFNPQGTRFVTAHADGVARIWPAFISTEALTNYSLERMPRCLTPEQRSETFLGNIPPEICLERMLWPYGSADWAAWRQRHLAGLNPSLPSARGRLGVTGVTLTPEIALASKLAVTRGAAVTGVVQSGAADRAAIEEGDVIIRIDRLDITTMEQLTSEVQWKGEGRIAKVEFDRFGKLIAVDVRLDAYIELEAGTTHGDNPVPDKLRDKALNRDVGFVEEQILVKELNKSSIAAGDRGDFREALRGRELVLSRLSNMRRDIPKMRQDDDAKAEELADAVIFSEMAWYALLSGQKERALKEADKAKEIVAAAREIDETRVSIAYSQLNIAHALLVNDRVAEARAIYIARLGQVLEDGRTWQATALDDLEQMKKHGLSTVAYESIAADLRDREPLANR